MPEGPSIVLLKQETEQFEGKKVTDAIGNTTAFDLSILQDKKLISIKSWGKHFLLCFKEFTIRIHFMMFGSYTINQKKEKPVRLGLIFSNGAMYFYSCSVKIFYEDPDTIYDFTADVMNDSWDENKAKEKLAQVPNEMICDTLLDQDIFSGVGNIIKNEVLYRVHVHPESLTGQIPLPKLSEIISEARIYSFQFLLWKKNFILKKQWLAHTKKVCLSCNQPIIKKYTGKKKRRSFFCTGCQILYTKP